MTDTIRHCRHGAVAVLRHCAVVLGLALLATSVDAAPAQRTFASPDEAAAALVAGLKGDDDSAVRAILGAGAEQWVRSGDAVADRAARDRFVQQYDQQHAIEQATEKRAWLTIGVDRWPFAFPLVRTGSNAWRFDTEAGKRELLARRVGQNELDTIQVMLAVVDAQREYAAADRNRDGVREYARLFASTAGKRDGLYWQTPDGEAPSPLGEVVTRAASEGYTKEPAPYHGYYFRMLQGQGSHAPGGALDYVVRGHMIGGFAAVAYPARYGNSGVMTFIVNHDGVVYQKDLGPNTATLARAITRFDPGPGWTPVKQD